MMPVHTDGKESVEWRAAAAALQTLLKKEDFRAVEHVFAHVVGPARRASWQKQRQVKPSASAHVCFYRLIGKRCPSEKCDSPSIIPNADHCPEWRGEGHTEIIVSQPYELRLEKLKGMVALSEKHNLDVTLRAWESWHFPGNTLSVEYRRAKPRAGGGHE